MSTEIFCKDEPIVTAKKFLEHKGLLKTVPDSFIICSFDTVLQLMKYYKIRKTGSIFRGGLFTITTAGIKIGIVCPHSYGAPAIAMAVEELIALGVKRFILIEAAGALQPFLTAGSTVLSTNAIPGEGVSRYYSNLSDFSKSSPYLNRKIESSLKHNEVLYSKGVTWTTDAFYRETKGFVKLYSKKGVVCVDMDASALFSVAQYHKVDASALFYITDSLANLKWEPYFGSKDIEKTKLLLAKSAIDSFCMIKNPSFKIRPVRLNMRGLVLSSVIKFAEKCKRLIT